MADATGDAELTLVPLGDDGAEGPVRLLSVHTHDPGEVVSAHVDLHSGVADAPAADATGKKLKAARFRYDVPLQASLDGQRRRRSGRVGPHSGIATFLPRVSRFNDLFADGGAKATLGFAPPHRGT